MLQQERTKAPGEQAVGLPEGERLLAKEAAAALNGPPVDPAALKGRFTVALFVAVAAATCGSSFIFGYNIGAINAPGEVIKQWINTTAFNVTACKDEKCNEKELSLIWSFVVGIFALGGVIGGLLCGYVADRFGRKGAMMLNNIICIIGGAIMTAAKYTSSWQMLLLGRFIIGINCGLNSGLAPMYLTEIAPVNYRGLLGSANQLLVTVAILVANIIGLHYVCGTEKLWPLVLAFTIVPAIFQLAVLPFCPESPKYLLIIKHQRDAAEKALQRLRKKVDVSAELKVMQDESDKIANSPRVRFGDMFVQPLLRWALIIAVMMMLAQQFSGINAAMYFSSFIFEKIAKLSKDDSGWATIGMCAINVVMTIISTAIVDRLGRRILMLIGMAGMWLCSIAIVICLHYIYSDREKYKDVGYGVIAFVFLFVISFATGPGSIPWFYVSELFDQGARGNANAVAIMVNWLANFIVGMSFSPLAEFVLYEYAFLIFTGCLTIFILFTFFYAPETKGRQLEDIHEELKRKAPGYRGP